LKQDGLNIESVSNNPIRVLYNTNVFPDYIKVSTKFKDVMMKFESITQYAGEKFDGSIAYNNVAKEIIKW